MRGVALARAAAGFVLGAVMVVVLPPLGLAIALVVAGVLLWARLRDEDAGPLVSLGGGYLTAAGCYLVLAVVAALTAT